MFGAYTAVDWPSEDDVDYDSFNVADLSGKSFMFSLINKFKTPFRLKLVDNNRAINVGAGLAFGGLEEDAAGNTVKFCNLLMYEGGAANTNQGMYCNSFDAEDAYRLDETSFEGGRTPAEFKLDATTLAGSQYFAASEIEVYSI
ncbi:MAG: hypothetical protein Q7T57_03905 [Dehalococcoidales bacterium]|nr:hypothetical protein [Dehalococcoidales bacterium]